MKNYIKNIFYVLILIIIFFVLQKFIYNIAIDYIFVFRYEDDLLSVIKSSIFSHIISIVTIVLIIFTKKKFINSNK